MKANSVFFEGKKLFSYQRAVQIRRQHRQGNKRKKNKTKRKPNWVNNPNIFIFAWRKTHEMKVTRQVFVRQGFRDRSMSQVGTKLRKLNTISSVTHFPDNMFLQLDVEW